MFADLHIHIGRASSGEPVKITASDKLTIQGIMGECHQRKGIQIAGIIDCASPPVLKDIKNLLEQDQLVPLAGGGLTYKGDTTLILGAEVELAGPHGGSAHFLAYTPTLGAMEELSSFLGTEITNICLSSQRARMSILEVNEFVTRELGGMFFPAHAFTPFKGAYGNCVASLDELGASFPAIELGLSSDSDLADRILELENVRFLSNSDAHSLPKIAREYNALRLQTPDFAHLKKAIHGDDANIILANYGLDPRLGKYHRTYCLKCDQVVVGKPPIVTCPTCSDGRVVLGVLDGIVTIAKGQETIHPSHRPPYIYQIPLEFIPGVGPKTLTRLLDAFGTEMQILHGAAKEELAEVVGSSIAGKIVAARTGSLAMDVGGGGRYGRIQS